MLKIGLTGGIGSGKTTIAGHIRALNYPVYVSDTEAARLIRENAEIRTTLIHYFGADIYLPDNTLNKKKTADIIFNDKEALKKINDTVHPVVLQDFNAWCDQQESSIVFFESAILFESGLSEHFDCIICIYADTDIRIRRVMKRDGLSEEKVLERIRNQMDDKEKCERSDFVINTGIGLDTKQEIMRIIEKMEKN